jgi:hypothetical protein
MAGGLHGRSRGRHRRCSSAKIWDCLKTSNSNSSATPTVVDKDNTLIVEAAVKRTSSPLPDSPQIERRPAITTEKLQERLAKLTGGVAVVKAATEYRNERIGKDLIDDALRDQKRCRRGTVPGGGVSATKPSRTAEQNQRRREDRFDIFRGSTPAANADNAGEDGEVVVAFWEQERILAQRRDGEFRHVEPASSTRPSCAQLCSTPPAPIGARRRMLHRVKEKKAKKPACPHCRYGVRQ